MTISKSELCNKDLLNTCINKNIKGPLMNQSRKNLEPKLCPCIFVPVEQYYDTFKNLFNSDWEELNFYMFKSGISGIKLVGEIGINHGGVIFEIKYDNSYKYFMLGEVEIGDKTNKVGTLTNMLQSVFPGVNKINNTINEPFQALILAGEICIPYLNKNINTITNPQERINIVLQNCHLSLGGSDEPVPLLLLKNKSSENVNKLLNIISFIKKIRNSGIDYIFIGVKSLYPDYKTGELINGYPYTCETFASILSSYIYKEFKTEIGNNKYLLNIYNQILLPDKNDKNTGMGNTMVKGRYKNEQVILKFLRPGFLNIKTQQIESIVGVKWKNLTKEQQKDCFKFYDVTYDIVMNNPIAFLKEIQDIITNIRKPFKVWTDIKNMGKIMGKIIKQLLTLNLDNFWIRCYSSQDYINNSEPTFFSFPLKNNILLDNVNCNLSKSICDLNNNCKYNNSTSKCELKPIGTYNLTEYKYQGIIIENMILMTISSILSEEDFDPFINLTLLNKNISSDKNVCMSLIFIISIIILIILTVLVFFVIKCLIK
jgi:hypothetical protein